MMFPAARRPIACSWQSQRQEKSWPRCRRPMVHTRNAILPDVEQIHSIIRAYSGNGTLLPRTLAELRENVRDFVVVEDEHGKIVGCGALHLYGMHLAEIRSRGGRGWTKGLGAGRKRVEAVVEEGAGHEVACVCLFTRIPGF